MHNLKNLFKEETYLKDFEKPTIINLILTNKPKCFQHSCTYKTGISEFHKMTITVMKVFFKKQKPKRVFIATVKTLIKNHLKNISN